MDEESEEEENYRIWILKRDMGFWTLYQAVRKKHSPEIKYYIYYNVLK